MRNGRLRTAESCGPHPCQGSTCSKSTESSPAAGLLEVPAAEDQGDVPVPLLYGLESQLTMDSVAVNCHHVVIAGRPTRTVSMARVQGCEIYRLGTLRACSDPKRSD